MLLLLLLILVLLLVLTLMPLNYDLPALADLLKSVDAFCIAAATPEIWGCDSYARVCISRASSTSIFQLNAIGFGQSYQCSTVALFEKILLIEMSQYRLWLRRRDLTMVRTIFFCLLTVLKHTHSVVRCW